MKKLTILSIVGLLSLLPVSVWADVRIHEWYGLYDMNHDGWRGILIIGDSHALAESMTELVSQPTTYSAC